MRYLFVLFTFLTVSFAQITELFPPLTSHVVDSANLLHVNTKQTLETVLKNEENNSSNQIVIVTINSLQGYPIEDFSLALARHWGIGQKEKDNGVLLLVAKDERRVRIEVGYGLEGALTDKISHEIITYTIAPYFKKEDFDNGILKATDQILSAIKGEYESVAFMGKDELGAKLPFIASMFGFLFLVLSNTFKSKAMRSIGLSSFLSSFSLPITISLFGLGSFFPYLIFLALFALIFLFTKNMKMQQLSKADNDFGYIGGNFGKGFGDSGFGGSFGGGFSGGGGGFGGGGASGGW